MRKTAKLFTVFLFTLTSVPVVAQIGEDGTGTVDGYEIGPNADLRGANLKGADLKGANLMRANLVNAILEGADLRDAIIQGADLQGANLRSSNMQGANFERAIINGADLSDSNLTEAILTRAVLVNANLSNANLARAILFNTNLGGANFTGANLYKVVSGFIVGIPESLPDQWILSIDGSFLVGFGADLRAADFSNTRYLGLVLTSLTRVAFEKITALESSAATKSDQITELQDRVGKMNTELQQLANLIPELQASVVEKDAQIANLSKRPTLEQVQEGRAGSVVLSVDPGGGSVRLGLTIEQSGNLINWSPIEGELSRTIPIPDGKRFYRFALDK